MSKKMIKTANAFWNSRRDLIGAKLKILHKLGSFRFAPQSWNLTFQPTLEKGKKLSEMVKISSSRYCPYLTTVSSQHGHWSHASRLLVKNTSFRPSPSIVSLISLPSSKQFMRSVLHLDVVFPIYSQDQIFQGGKLNAWRRFSFILLQPINLCISLMDWTLSRKRDLSFLVQQFLSLRKMSEMKSHFLQLNNKWHFQKSF